jgi:hypothetical protein
LGGCEYARAATTVVQQNSHLRRSPRAHHSGRDVQIPITVQINQDRGCSIGDRIVGGSLKRAIAIAKRDADIAITDKNSVQLLIVVHISETSPARGLHGLNRRTWRWQGSIGSDAEMPLTSDLCPPRSRTKSGGHGGGGAAGEIQQDTQRPPEGAVGEVGESIAIEVPDKQRSVPTGKTYLRWGATGKMTGCVCAFAEPLKIPIVTRVATSEAVQRVFPDKAKQNIIQGLN